MNGSLLLAAWLAPLLALPLSTRAAGAWFTALAALPALVAGLLLPAGTSLALPWLLLGTHLEMDQTGRLFLVFSATLWLFAGICLALTHAGSSAAGRLRIFMLLAMAGNLLLILAADMLTFYAGFALMGLSAYGLVAHRGSAQARRAGRLYLAFTLAGEVALLSAIMLVFAATDTRLFAGLAQHELPQAAIALLILGFGIKLALPGLHFWLPLAYPAAPAVAAAVLSGPMISAGLLGWLRYLPPGTSATGFWTEPLLLLGSVAVLLGIVAGVAQRDPRAVLAYSSIMKMGLITAVFGITLAHPDASTAILAALVLFAMHHLLVKGALFLGVAEWERRGSGPWVLAGLGALALALAGAPLTAGAVAKQTLGDALDGVGENLGVLFGLSAFGTVLLMARFMWLVWRTAPVPSGRFTAASMVWLVLVVIALYAPFGLEALADASAAFAPLTAGLLCAVLAWAILRRRPHWQLSVPPGDLLALLPVGLFRRLLQSRKARAAAAERTTKWRLPAGNPPTPSMATAGLLWLGLFCLLLAVLVSA